MFEAEAEKFRKAGLRVGADSRDAEASLLEEVLQPFDVSMRNAALQMSRLYALIYCFENSVRDLIASRLSDKHGSKWWDQCVPQKVQQTAKAKQETAAKQSWLEGQKKDILGFADFGDLCTIIVNNWADFTDLVPSQHWLKQRMDELEMSRHFIAHNRLLLPAEFQRIYMYIADWNRMVGL